MEEKRINRGKIGKLFPWCISPWRLHIKNFNARVSFSIGYVSNLRIFGPQNVGCGILKEYLLLWMSLEKLWKWLIYMQTVSSGKRIFPFIIQNLQFLLQPSALTFVSRVPKEQNEFFKLSSRNSKTYEGLRYTYNIRCIAAPEESGLIWKQLSHATYV